MRELSDRADKSPNPRRTDPKKTTCSRSPPTAAWPHSTCACSAETAGEDAKLRRSGERPSPQWRRRIARDTTRRTAPTPTPTSPASLQLVFCDLGTPSARSRNAGSLAGGWNAYDELKQLLAERGVPADDDPLRPRGPQRQGERRDCSPPPATAAISVLLGSTEKMGVGTNVQARAIALHHLDCPWRPADIAQREGRILRQGNLNPEVEVIRYVSEGSFDAYLWQTVERKARFIGQVMRGSSGRARDRRHRRHRPVLQRGQSPRHRRPPDPGEGPHSTPNSPASSASNAPTAATSASCPATITKAETDRPKLASRTPRRRRGDHPPRRHLR